MSIPLIAIAAAQTAASLYQSKNASDAAQSAASMSAEQQQKALDFQKGVYEDQKSYLAPYREAGKQALGEYRSRLSGMKQPEFGYSIPEFNFSTYEDPGANYQMSRAQKALNASSLAKGIGGGSFAKAMASKQQEMAGTAYQNAWNRYTDNTKLQYGQAKDRYDRDYGFQKDILKGYGDLATSGQNAATGIGQTGASIGASIGNTANQLGNSLASGVIGQANAQNQGIGSAVSALSQGYGLYKQQQQQDFDNAMREKYLGRMTNDNLGGGQ